MSPRGEEDLWTAADVAAYLRCSIAAVRRRAAAGTIPSRRIGGRYRFLPDDVRAVRDPPRVGVVVPLGDVLEGKKR